MTPDTVNDRCARCSQSEDDLLMDAERAAKQLMADASEVTALRARVKELEAIADWVVRRSAEMEKKSWPLVHVHDHACAECGGLMVIEGFRCAVHLARALHRPTPSQERP